MAAEAWCAENDTHQVETYLVIHKPADDDGHISEPAALEHVVRGPIFTHEPHEHSSLNHLMVKLAGAHLSPGNA